MARDPCTDLRCPDHANAYAFAVVQSFASTLGMFLSCCEAEPGSVARSVPASIRTRHVARDVTGRWPV